jgi:hypothetical protein
MQKNTARHPPAACASRVVRDETIKRARDKYHKVIFIRADKFVGWVERSDTHQFVSVTMGSLRSTHHTQAFVERLRV